jgi:small nuclear ribonucleoprotein (snRNP)-like protein
MNLVLDDAEEVSVKKKTRKPLGNILSLLVASKRFDYENLISLMSHRKNTLERRQYYSDDEHVSTPKI